MTAYYATAAYRSAVAHPYHVSTYADWSPADPTTVVGFQTETEARAYASGRPEPLIDLVQRDCGVIAARRMLPGHSCPEPETCPAWSQWTPRDDFPPMCWQTRCPTDPAYPHNEQTSCREAARTED